MNICLIYLNFCCGIHKNFKFYLVYIFNTHNVSTTVYMYLLSSIICVPVHSLPPPNTIIQLVVGVTLHTEREWYHLPVTVSGILNYRNNNSSFYINHNALGETLTHTHACMHTHTMQCRFTDLMDGQMIDGSNSSEQRRQLSCCTISLSNPIFTFKGVIQTDCSIINLNGKHSIIVDSQLDL